MERVWGGPRKLKSKPSTSFGRLGNREKGDSSWERRNWKAAAGVVFPESHSEEATLRGGKVQGHCDFSEGLEREDVC